MTHPKIANCYKFCTALAFCLILTILASRAFGSDPLPDPFNLIKIRLKPKKDGIEIQHSGLPFERYPLISNQIPFAAMVGRRYDPVLIYAARTVVYTDVEEYPTNFVSVLSSSAKANLRFLGSCAVLRTNLLTLSTFTIAATQCSSDPNDIAVTGVSEESVTIVVSQQFLEDLSELAAKR